MANELRFRATIKDDVSGPLGRLQDKFATIRKDGAKPLIAGAAAGASLAAFNAIGMAASAAGAAIIDFGVDSINAASDLNETMSKSQVIFGQNSAAVEAWADTMAVAAGQSKKAALDAASGFAGLFKTVGIGIDQSTEMSQGLTQLGSDLASFFNTDVDEALAALKSGLNGESEPLRRFNVFLSETAVSAKLAEMGVKKTGGAFTEAQKATARYALIMEQTGDAQGDFARTSDGLANSQRITAAEMENLQATIGQELLPIMRDLSNWAKDEGVPALRGLVDAIKEAEPVWTALGLLMRDGKEVGAEWAQGLIDQGKAQEEYNAAVADSRDELIDFRKAERESLGTTKDFAAIAGTATGKVKGLGGAAQKAADAFADLKRDAKAAGRAIAEATYGPELLRLEFERNKSELKDNQKEQDRLGDKIQDLERRGVPVPKALRDKFRDAKSAVLETKQAVIEGGIELTAMGKIKFTDLQRAFDRMGIKLDNLAGSAREYWYWLSRASNVNVQAPINNPRGSQDRDPSWQRPRVNGGENATGGFLPTGYHGTVGEVAMERIDVTAAGAQITPIANRQGSGGDVYVTIQGVSVLTPGAADALVWQLEPILTRRQQQRRAFAPA